MRAVSSPPEFPVAAYRPTSFGTPDWNGSPPSLNGSGDLHGGIPWSRYIDAVRRYALLIVAVILVGSFLGSVFARQVRPTYEASSIVWINSTPSGAQQSGPIRQQQLVSAVSWLGLLQS